VRAAAFKAGVIEAPPGTDSFEQRTKDIAHFNLRDTQVPLPLGWMLSAAAAKTIREQINLVDDVVQNQTATNKILKTLPSRQ
jgi:hypothetical protein